MKHDHPSATTRPGRFRRMLDAWFGMYRGCSACENPDEMRDIDKKAHQTEDTAAAQRDRQDEHP